MKKIIYLSLLCAFVLIATACGSTTSDFDKTKTEKFNELSYNIPTNFEKVEQKYDTESKTLVFSDYYYSFTKMGTNGKYDDMCTLSFSYGTPYDEKETLEEYAKVFEGDEKDPVITTKTINGQEWLIYKVEDSAKWIKYKYYTKYNNLFYTVTYDDLGSDTLCEDARKVIENGLKF